MSDPTTGPVRVLFVCLGNICRSPMAEAVFRHKVEEADLATAITVDSAGTGNWHVGEPPHHGTRNILTAKGISSAGLRARQIDRTDLETFDYVLTMDGDNLRAVRRLHPAPSAVVRPLMDYAPHVGVPDVPDPYYTGGFDGVFDLVSAACDGLLAAIRRERGL